MYYIYIYYIYIQTNRRDLLPLGRFTSMGVLSHHFCSGSESTDREETCRENDKSFSIYNVVTLSDTETSK